VMKPGPMAEVAIRKTAAVSEARREGAGGLMTRHDTAWAEDRDCHAREVGASSAVGSVR
jgi:hypothetical protein